MNTYSGTVYVFPLLIKLTAAPLLDHAELLG